MDEIAAQEFVSVDVQMSDDFGSISEDISTDVTGGQFIGETTIETDVPPVAIDSVEVEIDGREAETVAMREVGK